MLTLVWTLAYRVKSLPHVSYDIGEMYSGLIPIDNNDTSRQLFYVFQPTIGEEVDEITIWLNVLSVQVRDDCNSCLLISILGWPRLQLPGRLLPREWPLRVAAGNLRAISESIFVGELDQCALVSPKFCRPYPESLLRFFVTGSNSQSARASQ